MHNTETLGEVGSNGAAWGRREASRSDNKSVDHPYFTQYRRSRYDLYIHRRRKNARHLQQTLLCTGRREVSVLCVSLAPWSFLNRKNPEVPIQPTGAGS